MPNVSIIMPVFQGARTIARAIRSVQGQTYRDWELIVVDDGSTDGTPDVVTRIRAGDSRIRLISLPLNVGAASAMNRGWRESAGSLIGILDADDVALPKRLQCQVDYLLHRGEIAVVGSAAHFTDQGDRYWRTVWMPQTHQELMRRRWYAAPFIHSTVMMRRQFLEATTGYRDGLRLGEDYDLWMRGFADGNFQYANLAEPLVVYRGRPVQRWRMIRASARVRLRAARREGRWSRGVVAAARILGEGAIERTGVFQWRDRINPTSPPSDWGAIATML